MSSAIPFARRPPAARRTALLIGCNPEIDAVVVHALHKYPWSIEHAPDNVSALALALKKAYALILTSDKSNGHEDVELLRQLRSVQPHTRLIILAHESTPVDVIDSMREHAFSYFAGAYTPESLCEMIRLAADEPSWNDGIDVISATPEWIRVLVRCDLDTADRLLQFLKEEISDLPEEERRDVALAAREILMNAIEYGGHLDPSKHVEISYVRAKQMVACRVTDPGEGFNMDDLPQAAIGNPLDDPIRHITYRQEHGMRPGGFGLLVTKKLVDELIYNEKGNEALLIKYLRPAPPPVP